MHGQDKRVRPVQVDRRILTDTAQEKNSRHISSSGTDERSLSVSSETLKFKMFLERNWRSGHIKAYDLSKSTGVNDMRHKRRTRATLRRPALTSGQLVFRVKH